MIPVRRRRYVQPYRSFLLMPLMARSRSSSSVVEHQHRSIGVGNKLNVSRDDFFSVSCYIHVAFSFSLKSLHHLRVFFVLNCVHYEQGVIKCTLLQNTSTTSATSLRRSKASAERNAMPPKHSSFAPETASIVMMLLFAQLPELR